MAAGERVVGKGFYCADRFCLSEKPYFSDGRDVWPVSYTHLAVSEALSYLRQKGLFTVEDLEAFLEASGKSAADYRNQMKPKEARSKVIDGILASRTDCKECKAVYEKYQKIFSKKTKASAVRGADVTRAADGHSGGLSPICYCLGVMPLIVTF